MKNLVKVLSPYVGEEDLTSTSVAKQISFHNVEYLLRVAVAVLKEAAARVENSGTSMPAGGSLHAYRVGTATSDENDKELLKDVHEEIRLSAKTVNGIRKRFLSHFPTDVEEVNEKKGVMSSLARNESLCSPSKEKELSEGKKKKNGEEEEVGFAPSDRKRQRKHNGRSEDEDSDNNEKNKKVVKRETHRNETHNDDGNKDFISTESKCKTNDSSLDLGQYVNQKDALFGGNDAKKNKFARLMGGAMPLKKGSSAGGERSHHDTVGKTMQEINKMNEDLAKEYDFAVHHKSKKGLGA